MKIKLIQTFIFQISQLVEKEKLLPATHESTMTSKHFSPDEDIYLLEVPRNVNLFSLRLFKLLNSFNDS